VDALERDQIGAAFVDRLRLGLAILVDRLFEMALGCSLGTLSPQRKIDRLVVLVDKPDTGISSGP
jgi:hypothetical protein